MTISLETVCTDAHLANEVGGPDAVANLVAKSQSGSSALVRQATLDEVLRALRRRAPPIYPSDLSDPTELRSAVVYGSLARLYWQAATTPDSIFITHAKRFDGLFESEVEGLTPTVNGGESVASLSYGTERR